LKTIEDRNEQLFSNKQTLADFGVSLAAADKNVSSLSEDVSELSEDVSSLSAQLAKVLDAS
jgi:ABC-type transporter Mla subunit MlaD